MSYLFGNHIVVFPKRRLKFYIDGLSAEGLLISTTKICVILLLFKDRVSVPGGQNTDKTQVINY